LGVGKVRYKNEIRDSKDVLEEVGMLPLHLSYKEGLAFNNGTSMMTAIAVLGLIKANKLLKLADISASLTLECL
jgi:histidine ammonia-lyase